MPEGIKPSNYQTRQTQEVHIQGRTESSPDIIFITATEWLERLHATFLHTCVIRCTAGSSDTYLPSTQYLPSLQQQRVMKSLVAEDCFLTSIQTIPAFYKFTHLFIYGSRLEIFAKLPSLHSPIIYATTEPLPSRFFMQPEVQIEYPQDEFMSLMKTSHLYKTSAMLNLDPLRMLRLKQNHLVQSVWYSKMDPVGDIPCQIIPGLFLGSKSYAHLTEYDIGFICRLGLDYVDTDIPYVQHRILDTPTAPLYNILIDSLTEIHKNLSKGKNVYVHCQAGVSRSSSIVIAYLMKYKQMSLFEAWDITFKSRPICRPNVGFAIVLYEMELEARKEKRKKEKGALDGFNNGMNVDRGSMHFFWLSYSFTQYIQYLEFMDLYEGYKLGLDEKSLDENIDESVELIEKDFKGFEVVEMGGEDADTSLIASVEQ